MIRYKYHHQLMLNSHTADIGELTYPNPILPVDGRAQASSPTPLQMCEIRLVSRLLVVLYAMNFRRRHSRNIEEEKMIEKISKIDAARRQLDTAIDLYFDDIDALSCFTLAYASLKVLFDLYPHHKGDDFATQIDRVIGEAGWKHISGVGNFLKHADRDPEGMLERFDPENGMAIIGLATLIYRRITGEFSLKMMAFDCWAEAIGADELGIPELDQNEERATLHKQFWNDLNGAPRGVRINFAKKYYHFFMANHDRLKNEANQALNNEVSLQEALDKRLGGE